ACVEVLPDIQRSLPFTDLGRTRLSEEQAVASSIFRIWVEALLKNIDDVECRPFGNPLIDVELARDAEWLEHYSAFELYRLAKTAWTENYGQSVTKNMIKDWERGKRGTLPIGRPYPRALSDTILNMILPKIVRIVLDRHGHAHVYPPH